MKNILHYISKHPIQIIIFVLALLGASVLGISQINIETGNSTLIKSNTKRYIDNDNYQKQFGGETIILQFEPDNELFDVELIQLFNQIEKDLSNQSGIFSYQSPASIVKNITSSQYIQFTQGISQMTDGLSSLSAMLRLQSGQLSGFSSDQIESLSLNIETAIGNLETGQGNLLSRLIQLKDGLEAIEDSLSQLETDLDGDGQPAYANQVEQMNLALQQMITMVDQLDSVPNQTIAGLGNMNDQLGQFFIQLIEQFDTMSSFSGQLIVLSDNLESMSVSLAQIVSFSDSFYPDVPKTQETLDQIVYQENARRPMFNAFVVNDKYLMMQITLNGDISKEEKDDIVLLVENEIQQSDYKDAYLLSGKAILDLSIQNSMVVSMKSMLALSVGLMVVILLITFRVRWRVLPLITVLLAVVITIGIMGYLKIPVSMVSMAVFPILIGLGIDYAIQFQNRYSSALEEESFNE